MNNWHEQEVPDFQGIYAKSENSYIYRNEHFSQISQPKINSYQDVAIISSLDLQDSDFRIHACEASGHGSIGVVVLEKRSTGQAIWSMLSNNSNPFEHIHIEKDTYLVTSTSGSVFSFKLPLNEPQLKIKM